MKNKYKKNITQAGLFASILFLYPFFISAGIGKPTPEASTSVITIGMTTALSGPSGQLGQNMMQGVETYFKQINDEGGIQGKKLKLIVLDDQYEPALAAPNMRKLIETDKVLAVIGNVGTPTAIVTLPIAMENHTLLFAPYTGADMLRLTPPNRYVINLRAGYEEETENMVKGLLSIGIKPQEIAFFTQNDAYGDAGYNGAVKALKAAGYAEADLLPYGRYTRNSLNVEAGLAQLIQVNQSPRAIIMIGAYAPNAKFIKLAKKIFPEALFINLSFVGTEALMNALGSDSSNVVITQVVPYYEENLPVMLDYKKGLKRYFPDAHPAYASLEGYLAAKLFVIGLRKAAAKNMLTREGIINAFESLNEVDIGIGEKCYLDKNHHQVMHKVWLTLFKDGKIIPVNWSDIYSNLPRTKP